VGFFDPVIPVLSYVYYRRSEALDRLYGIVTSIFNEVELDHRWVLFPPTADLGLAASFNRYFLGKKRRFDVLQLLAVWYYKFVQCGDFAISKKVEDVRLKGIPNRVVKLLAKWRRAINVKHVYEIEEWVNEYEPVFYETEALSILVKQATRQVELSKIMKRVQPTPVRMTANGYTKVYEELSMWLSKVGENISKVRWGDLPSATPPTIPHVDHEYILDLLGRTFTKKNCYPEIGVRVPIGIIAEYSKLLNKKLVRTCFTFSPPPPVYPAKVRMYTGLHYYMYYNDIPEMVLTLRDKLARKEVKYSIWFKYAVWEFFPFESTRRAMIIRAALTALGEVSRGFLIPSTREGFKKIFREIRSEIKFLKQVGPYIKPYGFRKLLKNILLLLM